MSLQNDVRLIKQEVLSETPPDYFSTKDIARSFFGALFLTSTFIFSSRITEQVKLMELPNIWALIITTFIVLTIEIYFIGYQRIRNKKERPFTEFWGKRIVTFWTMALLVSFGLAMLYAFDKVFTNAADMVKFAVVLSFPASVGAALADLLRRY